MRLLLAKQDSGMLTVVKLLQCFLSVRHAGACVNSWNC